MATEAIDKYNLTAAGLAAKIQYNVQYIRTLARTKKIPALKRGRAWLFNGDEVLQHLKAETERNASGDSILS